MKSALLFVCNLILSAKPVKSICIICRRKTWRLKDAGIQEEFEQEVTIKCQTIRAGVENDWKSIKNKLLEAADEICGQRRGGYQWHKKAWRWNKTVHNAVKEK